MRTTLAGDDDVLAAAKELATERKGVGEVTYTLARPALRPAETRRKTRNAVPLLKLNPKTSRVTSELVNQLREGLL